MGLLDRVETKTMTYYQTFLVNLGYEVVISKTHCGNAKTVQCRREHVCVDFEQWNALGVTFSFYRCVGEIWANCKMQNNQIGTFHVNSWGPDAWAEAANVALFLLEAENTSASE